jgi:hypothetical protein
MATLTRPGVEISQVITPGAPTVVTPTLVPCIVGPCFQIVKPIGDDGTLDAGAGVAVSAVIRGSASIAGDQDLSGKVLAIKVNNGDTQIITFEVTVGGALFSHALIENTINKGLSGATAAIIDNLLVIKSLAKGSTASLEIMSLAASGAPADTVLAYDDGSNPGFTDTLRFAASVGSSVTGQTNYVNREYLIPYKSLPSPLANVDEIVLEGANIDMYRYFGNVLTQFEETSAINWNSFTGGGSAFGGTATSRAHQPALGNQRTRLKAKAVAGKTSNILQSMGVDAKIEVPLAGSTGGHTTSAASSTELTTAFWLDANGAGRIQLTWPDPTGSNKLSVTAMGTAQYATSGNTADLGNYVGQHGNEVDVVFAVDAEGVTWNPQPVGQTSALTINYAIDSTMTEMQTVLNTAFGESTTNEWVVRDANGVADIKINLAFSSGTDLFLGNIGGVGGQQAAGLAGGWTAQGGKTFNLSGGRDPSNFGQNVPATTAGDDNEFAWVCGAVDLATLNTGATLGISGDTLDISIDGAPPVTATFDNDAVLASINAALGADATATLQASVPNSIGETYTALRIHSSSANGHDSLVQLSCSSAVESALFAGGSIAAATGAGGAAGGSWGGNDSSRRRFNIQRADYNAGASSALEQAIQPGTVKATISGISMSANIATRATSTNVDSINGQAHTIALTHNGFGQAGADPINADGTRFTITLSNWADNMGGEDAEDDGDPLALFAAAINAQLAATTKQGGGNAADSIGATVISGVLVLHDTSGVAGAELQVVASTGANAGVTTTQGIVDIFGADVFHTLVGNAVTVTRTATSTAGLSLTFEDNGEGNTIQCTASSPDVSGMNACVWPTDSVLFNTGGWTGSATQLSSLFLGTVGAPALALGGGDNAAQAATLDHKGFGAIEYATGQMAVVLTGDSVAGTPSDTVSSVATFTGGSTAAVSAKKVSACFTKPVSPSYTGTVFHGQSNRTTASDMMWENGTPLSRVVALQPFTVPQGSFVNAELVLADMAKDKNVILTDWYVKAEGLISGNTDQPRVEPEIVYNDLAGEATVKGGLNTNAAGMAIAGSAPVYTQYKALRKDVTSEAVEPGLLVFATISEVESIIGPIDPENPLAFALSLAFLNTVDINLAAFGVDETSADSPTGTVDGYKRALDYLKLKEVYALAPLTQDPGVHDVFSLHVTAMSEPENKKERIALVCRDLPTEKPATLVGGGNATIDTVGPGKFEFTYDETVNFSTELSGKVDANGDTIPSEVPATFTPSMGLYVEREGDAFKYLVTGMPSANVLQVDTNVGFLPGSGPGTGGNGDVYYRAGNNAVSSLADFEVDGEAVILSARQVAISTSTTAGKLAACEALAEFTGGAAGYQNRRLILMQPENVGTMVNGLEQAVDGHYLAAAVAAMVGQQNPSQPFTNLPMVGFTRPLGSSDKFSENQMATAAAGGLYWVIQDVDGGAMFSRHQLTTDVSSIKTRELSIVKAVDYVAKLIRSQVKRYIGKNNITKQLLETISIGITAALSNVSGSVVAAASLDVLTVDTTYLDTIKAEVSITPFYPANYIKITIFI